MKIIRILCLGLLVTSLLLSAAGKLFQPPEEVAFYEALGFTTLYLAVFGVQQLICVGLLLFPKARLAGGFLAAMNFGAMSFFTLNTEVQVLLVWLIPTFLAGIFLVIDSLYFGRENESATSGAA